MIAPGNFRLRALARRNRLSAASSTITKVGTDFIGWRGIFYTSTRCCASTLCPEYHFRGSAQSSRRRLLNAPNEPLEKKRRPAQAYRGENLFFGLHARGDFVTRVCRESGISGHGAGYFRCEG